MNAEGAQGPLNQRSDFKDAQQTCKRLYHECAAITGSGNKTIPPEQPAVEGQEGSDIDLMLLQDGDTVLLQQRIRLHLRHHDGNQAVTCGQRGNWDCGNLQPGVNNDFFSKIDPDA